MDLTIRIEGDSNTPVQCEVNAIIKDIKSVATEYDDDNYYINEQKRIKIAFNSNVYDYDSLTNIKTLNKTKKIKCTTGWKGEFLKINEDGIEVDEDKEFSRGVNYCRITIPACGLKVHGDDGVKQLISGNVTDENPNGDAITHIFEIKIDNSNSLEDTITAIEKLSDGNSLSDGTAIYNLSIADGTPNRNGKFYVKEAYYEQGWLNIVFEAEIEISECDYTCYIGYNKYGSPVKFKLEGLTDATSLFYNTAGGTIPWKFEDDNGEHIDMNAKTLTKMC